MAKESGLLPLKTDKSTKTHEGKFQPINVHFALRGVVGIRGRNVSAALAESPPRPSRVSENSMRYFRRNATNQPPIAG